MQNIYINRKATDLMSYYVNLAEQGKCDKRRVPLRHAGRGPGVC